MSSTVKKRILVVDDHPLTRQGLCEAFEAQNDFSVCGEAEGWREALKKTNSLNPDIILLDLNLKDGNGWELLRQFAAEGITVPVLVVTVCDEDIYAARLLQSGAKGYLMKDAPIDKVLEAVRKVLAGHIAVSDSIASQLIHTAMQGNGRLSAASELALLSNRELQVYALLKEGRTNCEIAEHMGISQKTIGTYKARLMEKFGVRTTPALLIRMQNL
jgi:DNA-binding NarL/FixJ family response regulator